MWIEDTYRRVHLHFHIPEWGPEILAGFDARQVVENVKRAHTNALYFFAKCHYGNAYYRTAVGHRNMGNRGFLAEIIEQCRLEALTAVGYFCFAWDHHALTNNPTWQMRQQDVNQAIDPWYHICYNYQYRQYTEEMLKEVAAYDLDGLHFYMFNFSFNDLTCYCDTCRILFFKRTGHHIPEELNWDETLREFIAFQNETITSFSQEMAASVHAVKPEMQINFNYHGSPGFDWRAVQKPIIHTTFSAQATGESYPAAFGVYYTSMEARFLKDLVPERPAEIVTSRFNGLWDYTVKPEAQLRWELATALSHGCTAMVVDQNLLDGQVDPLVYDRLAPVFADIPAKEKLWGVEPLSYAGLYYSSSSRDFYARGDPPKYLLSFGGVYRVLAESNLPVSILFDEGCTPERLRGIPVVILANATAMSYGEAEMFRRYVDGGGVLVSNGDTARFDELGEPRRELALTDVFGARLVGHTETDNHFVRIEDPVLDPDIFRNEYILYNSPAALVEPTLGSATGFLHLSYHDRREPYQTFSHNLVPSWKPVRLGSSMEEPLMHRAAIELPREQYSVELWSPNTDWKQDGRRRELLISDVHEAVNVEWKE